MYFPWLPLGTGRLRPQLLCCVRVENEAAPYSRCWPWLYRTLLCYLRGDLRRPGLSGAAAAERWLSGVSWRHFGPGL